MKGKLLRRVLSTVLSAVMVMSVFAVGGISASAADDDTLQAVIYGVTRKYTIANALLAKINGARSSSLKAIDKLTDEAMERAAQLPMLPNTNYLSGEYWNENTGVEAVGVVKNYTSSMTVDTIFEQLKANDDSYYFDDLLTNTDLKQIGVGVAAVQGNSKNLFVCVRTYNYNSALSAYDESAHSSDVEVAQATVVSKSLFAGNIDSVKIWDNSTGTLYNTSKKLSKGGSYTPVFAMKSFEGDSYKAYILPNVATTSTITETEETSTASSMYSGVNPKYTKSISPNAQSMPLTLVLSSYSGTQYTQTVTLESSDTYENTAPTFTADDVTLDCYEYTYDGTTSYKPTVLKVVDHDDPTKVLEAGTTSNPKDYRVKAMAGKVGEPNVDTTYYVTVVGQGDYAGVGEVKVPFVIKKKPTSNVSVNASIKHRNGQLGTDSSIFYTGEELYIDTTATSGSTVEVSVKDPDGSAVETSGTNHVFTCDKAGKYTATVTASKDSDTATKTLEINVTKALTFELVASSEEPYVNEEFTLTANADGGYGELAYNFTTTEQNVTKTQNGNVATISVSATGNHTFKCTVTDSNGNSESKEITVKLIPQVAYPTLKSRSLTIGGEIGLNIYAANMPEDGTVVMDGPKGEKTFAPADYRIIDSSQGTIGDYKFTYTVNAPDMDEEISFKVLDSNGNLVDLYKASDNSKVEGNVYKTTVNSYLEDAPATVTVADSMYSYGAYASSYFSGDAVDEDSLNADVKTRMEAVTAESLEKDYKAKAADGSVLPDGVTVKGLSLLIEDKTTLRLYVDIESGKKSSLTFKTYIDGTAVELTPKLNSKNNYYYVQITNIPANKLGSINTFEINGKKDGVAATYTLSCSPMSYAYSVLKNKPDNTVLCNLVKAMYCYFEDAKDYVK